MKQRFKRLLIVLYIGSLFLSILLLMLSLFSNKQINIIFGSWFASNITILTVIWLITGKSLPDLVEQFWGKDEN